MFSEIITLKDKIMSLSAFTKTCLKFTGVWILLMFFFFDWAQGIWLIIGVPFALLVILGLLLISIIYIPIQLKKTSLQLSVHPFLINVTTILIIIFFFFPLQNLRMDVYFLMHKSDFHQIVEWISARIENGDVELNQNDSYKEITLPEEYQDVTPEGKITLWDKNNTLIVFIPIGYKSDSVFVSSSSFVYNSAGYSIQFCEKQLNDNWSFCR